MQKQLKNGKNLLSCLRDKQVLITGGTGSFGETLISLFVKESKVSRIVIYSRDEQKHVAIHRKYKDQRLKSILGDVRNLERLRWAMKGIDYVFNAAAIKHVHFSEEHPIEVIETNILGAHHVCKAALEAGVKTLITISTDKAVEPVNVMGMSKALQERLVASYAGCGTNIGIVRYGNVLASNGSVIPFFKGLLESGADRLPVTDRRMTRFVLTLKDSVYLVLYALNHCKSGETFVMDLPAFKIWDVAEVMAKAGSRKGRQVKVAEIGIRPGERLHEALISSEEMRRAVRKDGFWIIRRYQSGNELFQPSRQEKSLNSKMARQLSKSEIERLLRQEGCLPRS